ncbi:MAG: macro domain-containing protein [Actinomycetales bacterium]|nr:macro domain-containing protein [Actinomycetales bacterium]
MINYTQCDSNYRDYENRCARGEVKPGVPYVFASTPKKNKPNLELVLNFPTKNDWRRPSQIEWVDDGLKILRDHYQEWGITSLALPPLGCGLGGLDWADVWPLIQKHLGDLPIEIELWVPDGEETDQDPDEEPTLFDL